jgi:hypothetical protein
MEKIQPLLGTTSLLVPDLQTLSFALPDFSDIDSEGYQVVAYPPNMSENLKPGPKSTGRRRAANDDNTTEVEELDMKQAKRAENDRKRARKNTCF